MALINADQLDTSPVEWTVGGPGGGIIPRAGYGVLWGKSQAGKSLLALDLAASVANDRPWLGFEVQHAGPVAYLAGEGISGLGIRLKARMARQRARDNEVIADIAQRDGDQAARDAIAALRPYDTSRISILTEAFPMYFDRSERPAPGMARALAQLSAIDGLELVIIDTLARFKGQLSLSNDSSASRIIQGMGFLANELNCFILAIAHPTADGRKMLGAEAIFNACETVIQVEPDEVGAPGALRSATVSSRKSREDEPFEPFGYVIRPCKWGQPAEDEDGNEIPGEMVTVTSATVERIERDTPSAAPESARQAPPLPQLQPVERRTKRNGIRRPAGGPAAVPSLDAARARHDMVRGILSVPCSECRRIPQMGCDTSRAYSRAVPISMSPPLASHECRILDAVIAGLVPESVLDLAS